jgi:hypothetical protein
MSFSRNSELVLREVNREVNSLGITEWYCPVPPPGSWFKVAREKWSKDGSVRRIYAWTAVAKNQAPVPVAPWKTRYYRCDGFTLLVIPDEYR